MSVHWEKVMTGEPKHEFAAGSLYRAKVPNGWILTLFWHPGTGAAGGPAICFYPDEEHVWDGSSLDAGVFCDKPRDFVQVAR